MPFAGMSAAGKEAEGWPREWGAYGAYQAKNWLPRSDYATEAGKEASDWYKNYSMNRAGQGLGTIDDARAWGSMIMPGVPGYISNKAARLNQGITDYGNLPTWQSTADRIDAANTGNKALNQQELQYIDQTRNYALQDIGDTYGRTTGYEDVANKGNVADLTNRYNDLLRANKDTFTGLRDSSNTAYSKALANAELLKPGSQFSIAQTARSFAPQVAATSGRLRRMGLDNTPQALSAIGRVETARSRAMDDAAGRGTQAYISAVNPLLTQQQADLERLGTGELAGQVGLSTEQGTGLRGEATRHAGAQTGLDLGRSNAVIGTQNTAMDRISRNMGVAQQLNNQDAQNALTRQGLALNDWQTRQALQGQLSDAELEGIGLNQQQFNAGLGYRTQDLAERNAGAANVGNYGQNQLGYGLQTSNAAQGWGNNAAGAYQTAYGYEAPNASWGTKMLGGLAGGALNYFAPGAGSIIPGMGGSTSGGWGAVFNKLPKWGRGGYGMPGGGINAGGWIGE